MAGFTVPRKGDDELKIETTRDAVWESEIAFMLLYTFYIMHFWKEQEENEADKKYVDPFAGHPLEQVPITLVTFRADKFASTLRPNFYEEYNNVKFVIQLIAALEKAGISISTIWQSLKLNSPKAQTIKKQDFGKGAAVERQIRADILEKLLRGQSIVTEMEQLNPSDRKKYILHKAILNMADWTASGHRELEPGLVYNEDFLAEKIKEKLRNEGKTEIADQFQYRDFQTASKVEGDVLAVAPTGSGKTEAALLWASQKKEFDNILYLLPTRVTSNAIYKRLCSYFGNEKVAVAHSSAYFLRKEIDDSYEEKEYAFIDKTFFKNVTVCTVDQVLTQGFNLGFWEVKTFHQLNARIIIDEIHLYEPYTLGLIIATIKYLQQEFNARFYIMTATMPEKLKTLLEKNLQSPSFIPDTELLDKARNQFEVRNGGFNEMEREITDAIQDGKKVLLVLNTVDSAIGAYEKFKPLFKGREDKIVCYHSRFIQKDRTKKEESIFEIEKQDEPCLLVATQVVEVSLDIDFNILFTENAPIDAIIQRAGRVNRKRRKKGTKVIVFQHSEIAKEYIYTLPGILENTFAALSKHHEQRLTERQLLNLVDEVYQNIEVESNPEYQSGLTRYKSVQNDQYQILDMVANGDTLTRLNIDNENIIPDIFQEALYDKAPMEKTKHEVSVRRTRLKNIKVVPDKEHSWFKYADVIYDDETGLKFKKGKGPTDGIGQKRSHFF